MGFWEKITAPLRSKGAGNPDWGTLERYLGWAFGGGVSSSGVVVNPQNAMQAAAVYSCVKVLAESVGMLPLCIYGRGKGNSRTLAPDHPLYSLLQDAPNEYQTSTEFLEMLVTHLNLRGNAYAWVNRVSSGRIVEIIPLHPDYVNVVMSSANEVQYRFGTEDGGQRLMDRSEILHVKGLTLNGWLGISPIAYAREAIGLALATEKFGGQLFRNGAKMGGVLEGPGVLTDAAYQRLKDSFDASTSGENAHKTAVLENGFKFSKMSMSSDEAQFLETRKYQRAEIAGLFRVPAHMINDLEKATFSNIEHMGQQFVNYSLMPWLVRIERAMRRDLFTPVDRAKYDLRFNPSSLLRGDSAARAEFYASGILNGWMTRNEAREFESDLGVPMNPLKGLDVPLIPLNMGDGTDDPDEAADQAEGETTKEPTSTTAGAPK